MLPVALDGLNQWIAARRFNSKAIALKSLRFGGHVAGAIDECENGFIRGWIYDARRSDDIIHLDVCVEDVPIAQIKADVYRDDLARLLDDNGIHGFEATIPALRYPTEPRSVTVLLADNPKYVLKAVETDEEPARDRPAQNGGLAAPDGMNGEAVSDPAQDLVSPIDDADPPHVSQATSLTGVTMTQDLDFRLQHIFDHITAAHEHTLRRLDKIEADIKHIKDAQDAGARNGRDDSSLLIYDAPRSSIAGIGSWQTRATTDRAEIAIVRTRVEQALLKARLGSRQRDRAASAVREAS